MNDTTRDLAIKELALALNSGTTEGRQQHVKRALGLLGLTDGEARVPFSLRPHQMTEDEATQLDALRNSPSPMQGKTFKRIPEETPAPTDYEPSPAVYASGEVPIQSRARAQVALMIGSNVKPKLDPAQVLMIGEDGFRPSKRFVMFSGGKDSTTLLHWMLYNSPFPIDGAVHVNTGIGIKQTRDFVRDLCRDWNVPLIEKCAPEGEYERLVTQYGFPGPKMHWQMYRYLKDRQIAALVKEHKIKKGDCIMLITGVRRSESKRRMGTVRPVWARHGQLWVAPFTDWTSDQMADYREANGVPENPVSALMHMSGECLCGAYAKQDEIKDIEAFYPETAREIRALEARVREAGQARCVWGAKSAEIAEPREDAAMCSDCQMRLELA